MINRRNRDEIDQVFVSFHRFASDDQIRSILFLIGVATSLIFIVGIFFVAVRRCLKLFDAERKSSFYFLISSAFVSFHLVQRHSSSTCQSVTRYSRQSSSTLLIQFQRGPSIMSTTENFL